MGISALGPKDSQLWPNSWFRQNKAPYFSRVVGWDGEEKRRKLGEREESSLHWLPRPASAVPLTAPWPV